MCCGELTLNRLFFALWPTKRKEAETEEGHWLRRMVFIAMILHCGLAIVNLAMVGFWGMFFNLVQAAWSYSCYLTLREREIWVYMVILGIQTIYQLFAILGIGEKNVMGDSAL